MITKELIQALEKLDPELPIHLILDGYYWGSVRTVEVGIIEGAKGVELCGDYRPDLNITTDF